MIVEDLIQTCPACPSQWEGTCEGRPVYVRYRYGHLTVSVGERDGGVNSAVSGIRVLDKKIGDSLDGILTWEEVEAQIRDLHLPSVIHDHLNSTPEEPITHAEKFALDLRELSSGELKQRAAGHRKLINEMVGTLYPQIAQRELHAIQNELLYRETGHRQILPGVSIRTAPPA